MKIVDGGITHIMKVIVLEVKLDVAKMVIDSSKYYIDSYFGPMHYNIRTYYDENGKDITNDLGTKCWYYSNGRTYIDDSSKGILVDRYRKEDYYTKFIGTDISTWDVEWKSSNPEKLIIMSTGGLSFQEVPPTSGSVTFTTKLGNETFSFVIDFNLCALPETKKNLKRVLGLQATGCDRSQLCYIIKHYFFAFVPVFMLSLNFRNRKGDVHGCMDLAYVYYCRMKAIFTLKMLWSYDRISLGATITVGG